MGWTRKVETKAGKGRGGGTKRMHDVVNIVRHDRKSSVKRCLFYSKIFLSFFKNDSYFFPFHAKPFSNLDAVIVETFNRNLCIYVLLFSQLRRGFQRVFTFDQYTFKIDVSLFTENFNINNNQLNNHIFVLRIKSVYILIK